MWACYFEVVNADLGKVYFMGPTSSSSSRKSFSSTLSLPSSYSLHRPRYDHNQHHHPPPALSFLELLNFPSLKTLILFILRLLYSVSESSSLNSPPPPPSSCHHHYCRHHHCHHHRHDVHHSRATSTIHSLGISVYSERKDPAPVHQPRETVNSDGCMKKCETWQRGDDQ